MAKDVKRRVLVGTYRPECLDWIKTNGLYNLPMKDGADLSVYDKISRIVLFGDNGAPLAYSTSAPTLVDKQGLKRKGYPVSDKPHGKYYALFELGKSLNVKSALSEEGAEVCVFTTRWTGVIDKVFFDRDDYPSECRSVTNIFKQLKPYYKYWSSAVAVTATQLDFMKNLGVDMTKKFPFPGPSEEDAQFTFIDLFAGIGGFRLAMQACGGRCVFSSEWNKDAQKTYYHNFGEMPLGDITCQATKDMIPDHFDVLCAGFPCQAFSIAGFQRGFEDTRGTLFFDVAQIIHDKRPRAFFLENVKNLKAHDHGNTYRTIHRVLTEDLGYVVFDAVMSPDEYANLPQNRERIFIVGFDPNQVPQPMINAFRFPEAVACERTIADCLEGNINDPKFVYTDRFGCYDVLVANMHRTDTIYQWRRDYLRENKSNRCPTLMANMGAGGHNVPLILQDDGVIRKLTPRECLNFQGFPAHYQFPNIPISRQYMQSGNSVAVPLIKRVARRLVNTIVKGV